MQKLRGKMFSMVFQDPMTALDPTVRIGKQVAEAIRIHNRKMTREEVWNRVVELMELVGIDHAQDALRVVSTSVFRWNEAAKCAGSCAGFESADPDCR